jgi:hypothetical protein
LTKAALLFRASQLAPGNNSVRFDAAFALAEANILQLALSQYYTVTRLQPSHGGALNNLGVLCDKLEMSTKAVHFFQRASDEGTGRASTNLANRYLDAGFLKEAEKLIEAERKEAKVDDGVGHTLVSIAKRKKEDAEHWQEAIDASARQQLFLTAFAVAASAPDDPNASALVGAWETHDKSRVNLTLQTDRVLGEWGPSSQRRRIVMLLQGQSARLIMESWEEYREAWGNQLDGLAYADSQAHQLWLLWTEEGSTSIVTWTRLKQDLLAKRSDQRARDPDSQFPESDGLLQ